MTNEGQYRCPECTGGFPGPIDDECPWCGQSLDGSYEYEPCVFTHTKMKDGDEREGRSPLETVKENLL